jgi:benzoate/toluate 1,2-dioxygenase subunit alpha
MPRIPVINTSHLDRIDELLVDDYESGEFKLHRSVFTDQALFDLEMKYIFEGNWVYLAHESQIPNNNDFYTTYIRRHSAIRFRYDRSHSLYAHVPIPG